MSSLPPQEFGRQGEEEEKGQEEEAKVDDAKKVLNNFHTPFHRKGTPPARCVKEV